MSESMQYWALGLDGADPATTVRWLASHVFDGRRPAALSLASEAVVPDDDWVARLTGALAGTAAAHFDKTRPEYLIAYPSGTVICRFPFAIRIDAALALLEKAPFEVASFGSMHDWSKHDKRYRAPGFGRNHFPHGWGCAFKGEGHARLITDRWLDHGPWKLAQGAAGTTLVQFHALDAGAAAALEQARPGHRTMGIGVEGGYVQEPYVFHASLGGLYDAKTATLRIVVAPGTRLHPEQALDAAVAMRQGALAADKPLRRVAYVFLLPADAAVYLHALWMRGLECWTIVDGVEKRLDADHRPPPARVEWAKG